MASKTATWNKHKNVHKKKIKETGIIPRKAFGEINEYTRFDHRTDGTREQEAIYANDLITKMAKDTAKQMAIDNKSTITFDMFFS